MINKQLSAVRRSRSGAYAGSAGASSLSLLGFSQLLSLQRQLAAALVAR